MKNLVLDPNSPHGRRIVFSGLICILSGFQFWRSAAAAQRFPEIRISARDASAIGKKIWQNECGGKIEPLTSWNKGEEFASLGIGHFIWYPKRYHGPFTESFPKLLVFLEQNGIQLPDWLKGNPPCPWNSREEFQHDLHSPRMEELRKLLVDTIALQARFEAERLETALPKMLDSLPASERDAVGAQFYRVARLPLGLYALMDYVNFKGEGVSQTERYKGEGWGLLQVLQGMSGAQENPAALDDFALSARSVLERRVRNSPPERNESRWLPVWKRRLQTYRVELK